MAGCVPLLLGSAAIAAESSYPFSSPNEELQRTVHPESSVLPTGESPPLPSPVLAPVNPQEGNPLNPLTDLPWASPRLSSKGQTKPRSFASSSAVGAIAAHSPAPLLAEPPLPDSPSPTSEVQPSRRAEQPPQPLAQVIDDELGTLEVQPSAPPPDEELGILQVIPEVPIQDLELGILEVQPPLTDPELGLLQISPSELAPQPQPQPWMTIGAYVAASSSDNIFLTQDPIQGRVGDDFVRPGLRWSVLPQLGPKTTLLAVVDASFLRYQNRSDANYDELRARVGVFQSLTDRVYGQVSFTNQWLFNEGFSDRFFKSHGVEWILGRQDPLTPRLTLDTFYQGQLTFAEPDRFSNLLNSAGATLTYRFHPQWDTGLSYRFTLVDYTQESRHEAYHRLTGQLRYLLTPTTRITVFGGLSGGDSSRPDISFDDSFFGISIDTTLRLF